MHVHVHLKSIDAAEGLQGAKAGTGGLVQAALKFCNKSRMLGSWEHTSAD
jgi:hypothetical protein